MVEYIHHQKGSVDIHEEAVVRRFGADAADAGDVHPGAFCGQKMKEAVIPEDAIGYTSKLTLMVREGSYAETFAKENGFKYAYFTPVSGITLSEQALTLKKGKSVALTAEIAPADATEQTLIWCSSDPKVATVTKGKVKAVGVGSCENICYASDGSNTRTVCSLTVEK